MLTGRRQICAKFLFVVIKDPHFEVIRRSSHQGACFHNPSSQVQALLYREQMQPGETSLFESI